MGDAFGGEEELDKDILKLYDVSKKKGKGAYSIVFEGEDRKWGNRVAIKKVFDAVANKTDAQRTYREVSYLVGVHSESPQPNIIQLLNVMPSKNVKDIYLVFEYMDTDLYAANRAGLLAVKHKKYIIYQCFKALTYMHSAGLVHRDLKPGNILVNENCDAKLADFGLTRSTLDKSGDPGAELTDYVMTRWYRGPEILLASNKYGLAVDMWSMGCITAEVFLGMPLFPGKTVNEMLQLIFAYLGRPTASDIESFESKYAAAMLDSLKEGELSPPRKEFKTSLPDTTPAEALDLIANLLVMNQKTRMTVTQAIAHAFLAEHHDAAKETTAAKPVIIELAEDNKFPAADYRQRILKVADGFKKQRKGGSKKGGLRSFFR